MPRQVEQRDKDLITDAIKLRFSPIDVASAEGVTITDADGKQYLDFSAGWALANAGYSHPTFKAYIQQQMERTTFAGLISSMSQPALELAEKLIALTPGDFKKKCWFGFCGSDANETVGRLLPMATGRRRMIAFTGSYHGFTAASMAMSGHVAFSEFGGSDQTIKIPYPNPYRPVFGEAPEEVGQRTLDYLENYILKQVVAPSDVAAVIIEAMQSDGGVVVPPPDFLPGLEAICRKHGIMLVLDEVKIGMGRTGKMFGFEHSDITPDVVVLGKALGGGVPLSAVIARAELLDVGTSLALFTAAGNGISCAGGLATLKILEEDNLIENAATVGEHLHQKLLTLAENHALIGNVRGIGLTQGVELVTSDGQPANREAAKVVYRAYELGLVFYYVGTFSNVLELTPPLIITKEQIDTGVEILDQALADVAAGKVSDEHVAAYAGW